MLTHFNPELEIIVSVDASNRAIAYVLRTLSKAKLFADFVSTDKMASRVQDDYRSKHHHPYLNHR